MINILQLESIQIPSHARISFLKKYVQGWIGGRGLNFAETSTAAFLRVCPLVKIHGFAPDVEEKNQYQYQNSQACP